MRKRLYRSVNDRMVGGVCGGIAEYFNIDPTIVRLVWVLFALGGGSGLVAYIVACLVIPNPPHPSNGYDNDNFHDQGNGPRPY